MSWKGSCTLVVYDHRWQHCQSFLGHWRGHGGRSILLDLASEENVAPPPINASAASISRRVIWAATIPTVIDIENGVIKRVSSD